MEEQEIMQSTISDFFSQLGIAGDFELEADQDQIQLTLDTKDTGIVIGYHGEVLESLQTLLSMTLSKKLDRFVRVTLEIGDYRKNRTSWLETVAKEAKEKVMAEQKEVPLPQLKSWERRIVHMFFQEDPEVTSESVGIGKDRVLVVKPRN